MRIKAGLKKAKEQWKKLGRPEVPGKIMKRAVELRAQKFSFREIGRFLDFNESTIRKRIKKLENK